MYNHSKAQQSKNRVHIFWDILYAHHIWWFDDGVSPDRRQAIVWTDDDFSSITYLKEQILV